VGDSSTHGKGTVQSLIQLENLMRAHGLPIKPNPGAVKITIRKFYRPSGDSTQLKGVVPDIVLPSVNNYLEVGEGSLDNPLPFDTIDAAKYEKINRIQPHLAELRKRSESRIAADSDFAFIRSEMERYKKSLEDKSVSLNEAQRLKEKLEADARFKARKKEIAQRSEPLGTTYEISLKQASAAGLPEPMKKGDKATPEPEKKTDSTDSEDDIEVPDSLARLDVTLEEAKRILRDLAALTSNDDALAATRNATPAK
jgi:carboxyl-terminal processing protease